MNKLISEKLGLNDDVNMYAEDIAGHIYKLLLGFLEDESMDSNDANVQYQPSLSIFNNATKFKIRGIDITVSPKGFHNKPNSHIKNNFFVEGMFASDTLQIYDDESVSFSLSISPNIEFSYVENVTLFKKDKVKITEFLRSTLTHEITHAFEEYERKLDKSKDNEFATSMDTNIDNLGKQLMSFIADKGSPEILMEYKRFGYLLYADASYEINARVAESYAHIKDKGSNDQKLIALKKTNAWDVCQMLLQWKSSDFMKHVNNFEDDGGIQFVKFLKNICLDINQSIAHDLFSQYEESKFSENQYQYIKKQMNHHGEAIKHFSDDPIKFFSYFEKKFNQDGEKMRRKLLRLLSI